MTITLRFSHEEIMAHCNSLAGGNSVITRKLFKKVLEVIKTAYSDKLTSCRLSSKHKDTILAAMFYIAGMLAQDDSLGLPFTEQQIASHFGVCERSVSTMYSFLVKETSIKEMKICHST